MIIRVVEKIPRKELLVLSEDVLRYIACLEGLNTGEALEFAPDRSSSLRPESQLRTCQRELKVALGKAKGQYILRRKKGCFYVKKMSFDSFH